MSELKQWREMHIDCPVCGSNPVEIYTKGKEDNYGCENDEMRCTECGVAGYWTEGIFGWKMEVSNENALIKFYEENEALKARVAELEEELSEVIKTAKIMHEKLAVEAVATLYAYELLGIKKDSSTDNAFEAIKKLKADNARMREALEELMSECENGDYLCIEYIKQLVEKALKGGE